MQHFFLNADKGLKPLRS